jgi:class 3 adenylate cyclase
MVYSDQSKSELEQIKRTMAVLEAQRAVLGAEVVETALASLRDKLRELEAVQQAAAGQRKQVTVLFADVVGFTPLSEKMDAEEATELVNRLWSAIDGIIVSHGGWIDKHIGDAVMALWGV